MSSLSRLYHKKSFSIFPPLIAILALASGLSALNKSSKNNISPNSQVDQEKGGYICNIYNHTVIVLIPSKVLNSEEQAQYHCSSIPLYRQIGPYLPMPLECLKLSDFANFPETPHLIFSLPSIWRQTREYLTQHYENISNVMNLSKLELNLQDFRDIPYRTLNSSLESLDHSELQLERYLRMVATIQQGEPPWNDISVENVFKRLAKTCSANKDFELIAGFVQNPKFTATFHINQYEAPAFVDRKTVQFPFETTSKVEWRRFTILLNDLYNIKLPIESFETKLDDIPMENSTESLKMGKFILGRDGAKTALIQIGKVLEIYFDNVMTMGPNGLSTHSTGIEASGTLCFYFFQASPSKASDFIYMARQRPQFKSKREGFLEMPEFSYLESVRFAFWLDNDSKVVQHSLDAMLVRNPVSENKMTE